MQVGHHDLVKLQSPLAAVQLEDARELLNRRVVDGDLVGNTAQERFVGQRRGVEVGGKDDEDVERDLEFLAGVQREVIDAAFERHDPPIEQVLGPDTLAPEIVDQQDAAVGLELERRLVELRRRVERQIQHVERELAAGDDDGPADADPAAIARRRGDEDRLVVRLVQLLVVDRIEHGDDVAVHVDRVRHVHLAADRAAEPLGDHRLAVPGLSVQKQGLVRVDGGPELLEDAFPNDQVRKPVPQPLAVDIATGCRQRAHPRDVGSQRHRSRTDVLVDLQILPRPIAAEVSQAVAVARGGGSGRAAHFDQAFAARTLDDRLEHARTTGTSGRSMQRQSLPRRTAS